MADFAVFWGRWSITCICFGRPASVPLSRGECRWNGTPVPCLTIPVTAQTRALRLGLMLT